MTTVDILSPVCDGPAVASGPLGASDLTRVNCANDSPVAFQKSHDECILQLARPNIVAMAPYSSARSLVSEAGGELAYMDANELGDDFLTPGLYPPRANRYPEPQPPELLSVLGRLYGVEPSRLCVGAGADAAIDAVIRMFCDPGRDAIVITPPTYGYYKVAAEIHGARVLEAPLKGAGWDLDEEAILQSVEAGGKVVFVCSPNNPTGHAFPRSKVLSLAARLVGRAVLVVDEAYGEFSRERGVAQEVADYPGLVVLKTLSKAWGLAGLRIGTAIAHESLIALMHKVRFPYPLSRLSTMAALTALGAEPEKTIESRVVRVHEERERLSTGLLRSPLVAAVLPSQTNFLLVRCHGENAHSEFLAAARKARVIVRDRGREKGLAASVRVSVGSPSENDLLIGAVGC
jgi:histidinol-phosphate aminotransferase